MEARRGGRQGARRAGRSRDRDRDRRAIAGAAGPRAERLTPNECSPRGSSTRCSARTTAACRGGCAATTAAPVLDLPAAAAAETARFPWSATASSPTSGSCGRHARAARRRADARRRGRGDRRRSATRGTATGSPRSPPSAVRRSPGSGSGNGISRPSAAGSPGVASRARTRVSGWRGLPGYEALAAGLPHPAYPTSESRPGFSDEDCAALRAGVRPGVRAVLGRRAAFPADRGGASSRRARPGWPTLPEVGLPRRSRRPTTCCRCTRSPPATGSPGASPRPGLSGPATGTERRRDRPGHRAAGDPDAVHPDGGPDRPAGHAPQAAAADQHPGPAQPPVDRPGHAGRRRARARHPGHRLPGRPAAAAACCSPTRAATRTPATRSSATCCAASRPASTGTGSCRSRRCSRRAPTPPRARAARSSSRS